MASGFTRVRVLMRRVDQLPLSQTPRTPYRYFTNGRPRTLSFPAPPPARRNFERAPLPTPAAASSTIPKGDDTHPAIARRPTNRQIPFSHVYVLDPDTQKLSAKKHRLEDLLTTYTNARQPLRQVIELVTASPRPIVRVTTRADIEARHKAAKRALKQGSRVGEAPKEVQLTWGVAPADVAHKLRKAQRDLDKGYRVVVTITVKRRKRPSGRETLVAFGDEIAEAFKGAAEECKEREVTDRMMVLSFRKVEADEDAP